MSEFVQNYRRNQPTRGLAPRFATWRLMLAGAGTSIAIAFCVLQFSLYLFSTNSEPAAAPPQDPALLGPALRGSIADDAGTTTASNAAMTSHQVQSGGAEGWFSSAYVAVISGLTGLVVLVMARLLWPARAPLASQVRPAPELIRPLANPADERRWHGGPIRN